MSSFMRLRARRNVDFPQPDGPMSAVTCRSGSASDTRFTAALAPYEMVRSRASIFGVAAGTGARAGVMSVACGGATARARADDKGHQVQGEGEGEEDEHGRVEERPRRLDVGGLRGEDVRVVTEVHELGERRARQVREEVGDPGEQDRGHLARASGDGEDGARED